MYLEMKEAEKKIFYNEHRAIIHSTIKAELQTITLWRKLF
tara:strand:- start:312 stop:431 length:120 start_codon:yes stop_codon:yes gene_type:complete